MALSDLSTGLQSLPAWQTLPRDSSDWLKVWCDWVSASHYDRSGVAYAPEQSIASYWTCEQGLVQSQPRGPAEAAGIWPDLRQTTEPRLWQMPGGRSRLYVRLTPTGASPGYLWVERADAGSWSTQDRAYLKLSASMMEASALLRTGWNAATLPLVVQQRLHDAARVAGRMAHDFDNVLQGVLGYCDLALPLAQTQPTLAKYLQEIAKAGQRGMVFTRQLHELSRSGQVKPRPTQIAALWPRLESQLRVSHPGSWSLHYQVEESLPTVALELTVLECLFGHLLANALEAMPQGGTVRIQVTSQFVDASGWPCLYGNLTPGQYVCVQIEDPGVGFKPEALQKLIQEPFYTTKVGRRGLGWPIVYRLVTTHGGGLTIQSSAETTPATTKASSADATPPPVVEFKSVNPSPPNTGTLIHIWLPTVAVRPTVTSSPPALIRTTGGS